MPEIEIPFRQWLPDQPDHNNPGLVEAKNVVLRPGGYEPFHGPDDPIGSATALQRRTDGVLFSYVSETSSFSDTGYLYVAGGVATRLDSSGISTVSNTYSANTSFGYAGLARFGNDIYIASESSQSGRPTHDLFKFNVSSRTFSTISSVPAGRGIERVGNFLVMSGIDSAGYAPYSFRWSGFNQPDEWATSETTQAGEAEIENLALGGVTAVVGGRDPLIFQRRGITRFRYVGPPRIWEQQLISDRQGIAYRYSAVTVDGVTYFMNYEGVWVVGNGGIQNVSDGTVGRWIKDAALSTTLPFFGAYHRDKRCIVWGFRENAGGGYQYGLVLNLETRAFSTIEDDYYGIAYGESFSSSPQPYGLIPQDSVLSNSKIASYSGPTLAATLTTGHLASAGERTFVDGVEPIYEGSGATVALSGKERIRDAASFSAYQAEESVSGVVEITSDARSTATSVKFAAGETWSDFSGVVANVKEAGER